MLLVGTGNGLILLPLPKSYRKKISTTTTTTTTTTELTSTNKSHHQSQQPSRKQKKGRNRLTNEDWYERRKQASRSSSSDGTQRQRIRRKGPKPPQWEKEGDQLYMKIVDNAGVAVSDDISSSSSSSSLSTSRKLSVEEAHKVLQPFLIINTSDPDPTLDDPSSTLSIENYDVDVDEEPFQWGGLSVGPVWKSRLVGAGYIAPTPIQTESFQLLASSGKNDNIVMAAPTGSGKSLAYLLPLLTTKTKSIGQIWVCCPTMELAFQLQSVVDELYATDDKTSNKSPFHVLQYSVNPSVDGSPSTTMHPILSNLQTECNNDVPVFLAATPKIFRQFQREIDRVVCDKSLESNGQKEDDDLRSLARTIDKNLETIVFDEADRLFQTEKAVTYFQKASKNADDDPPTKSQPPLSVKLLESCLYGSKSRRGRPGLSSRFPRRPARRNIQVIAVSATVGRSLRRQLMKTLQAPNIDSAARLVTLENRNTKNADKRRSTLLPTALTHRYQLLESSSSSNGDNDKPKTKAEQQLMMLEEILNTIKSLEPSPMLIFPGRIGVEAVQTYLRDRGFRDIRGLGSSGSATLTERGKIERATPPSVNSDWTTTPIYVIKERLSRGLDLPVDTVVMVGVPSSPSAYIHLAGRTARNDSSGTAITICRPDDANRLAMIADSLGVRFDNP